MSIKTFSHFIDGQWHRSNDQASIDCINPANGSIWARISRGRLADANSAVEAAHRAVTEGPWAGTSADDRAATLRRMASVLRGRWQDLVEAEVRDNGKRATEVNGQFAGLHHWYDHFAEEALKAVSHPLANDVVGASSRAVYEPYGVVVAITPWNSPLMIAAWKLAPALAAGNAVIIKPSEHASVSTLLFAEMMVEAGLPRGVLNVVTGFGNEVGESLVKHPLVAKVTFTGSDRGGRLVAEAAAAGVKPTTLELGGKSPQIVFADSDLDNAVNGVLSGIFLSNGQTCVAGSRLIIESSMYDAFINRLRDRVAGFHMGDPMDAATQIGPLANEPHLQKVLAMIEDARKAGATCILGGQRAFPTSSPDGYFVEPTLFSDVTPDMALWREEVFGPVLSICRFEDEAEALRLANDTDYGLAAGVWTSDTDKAERIARGIAAGTVYINHYRSVAAGTPVGGYKRSGYGRELGPGAVKDFMQAKAIWTGTAPCADPFPGT